MITKRRAIVKIVWIIINLLMFVAVSIIAIHEIVTKSEINVLTTLSMSGTGFVCVSGLSDIWVSFPDYMRALNDLNKRT